MRVLNRLKTSDQSTFLALGRTSAEEERQEERKRVRQKQNSREDDEEGEWMMAWREPAAAGDWPGVQLPWSMEGQS